MNREEYVVNTVLNVLKRIGFSEWKATSNIAILNHTTLSQEVILDIDQRVIPYSRIKPDLDEMSCAISPI